MTTTLLSTTTTITTTTTLLYKTSGQNEGQSNTPQQISDSDSGPTDRLTLRLSSESDESAERLKEAAKEYLNTLNTLGRAFGFKDNDPIARFARAVVQTGSGDDTVNAAGNFRISTGGGDDTVNALGRNLIFGGAGDDVVNAIGRSRVSGGSGDDFISTLGRSKVSGGSGDDIINTFGRSRVSGGSGDDLITSVGRSKIRSGSGDDIVNAFGRSRINTGSGDDIINAAGRSRINAGSGDDIITVYGRSHINGGAGDDVIIAGGRGSTIDFGKGDGSDIVYAASDLVINIGAGLTEESLNIAYDSGKATITFEGSDQELTIYFDEGSQVRLNFDNGQSLDLIPNINVKA